ncbi:DUF4890 domain-containing protein [Hymenobacter sp. BT635]|uniref:DUF4890 domain-containing protein n=1 Tax=Hymenobacter nitidus TaxID=2880929 RepID=A0ABS8AG11_9BACT|nr:DUF4890 domain-containing protein [Hymenobacter nitidus]MCB2379383.1 DUF4890 domain-containing protein [Hymenobacter nitidus]
MKSPLFSLLAAFALTIGTAAAQTQPAAAPSGPGREYRQVSPEERATRRTEKMTKELGLSADQSSRIKQILLTRDQEMQALRGQGKPTAATRGQMGSQMKANREKYDAQFKQILTAEQYTKYTELAQSRKQHGGKGHGLKDGGKMKAKNGKVKVKTTES